MTGIPTKIAAGVSLVALGSVAGYSVGSGPAGEQHPVAAAAKRQPVDVRTQTIRRTVRIVKHQRPRREPPAPAPAPAPATSAAAAVPAARSTPVAPQGASPQPTSSTPVRTRTSGAGPSGGEREREGRERGDD